MHSKVTSCEQCRLAKLFVNLMGKKGSRASILSQIGGESLVVRSLL